MLLIIFLIAFAIAVIAGIILIGGVAIKVIEILVIIAILKKIYDKIWGKKKKEETEIEV